MALPLVILGYCHWQAHYGNSRMLNSTVADLFLSYAPVETVALLSRQKIRVGCFGCDLVEQDLAGFGAVDPVGAFTANANIPVAHRFHRVGKVCKADLGAAPTAICSHTIYLLMFCRMSDNSIQYFFVFCNQRDI